jgi:Tfp pilus assembly protein PilN
MPKTIDVKHPRLLAQLTRRAKEITPAEARRRNLMIRARTIARLEQKARALTVMLKNCRQQLRAERKELRILTSLPDFEIDPATD